jgi:hypothetical protein
VLLGDIKLHISNKRGNLNVMLIFVSLKSWKKFLFCPGNLISLNQIMNFKVRYSEISDWLPQANQDVDVKDVWCGLASLRSGLT